MFIDVVPKPQQRSVIRKWLGKEYFILRRKWRWIKQRRYYSTERAVSRFPFSLIKHRSFLLRPLKNVEMYLQHNKVTNLALAIKQLNGVIIKPGETFSIWKLVGRPTKAKGYLPGLTLDNGTISSDIGGGLCQLGNLLYWMALHTPLTIKERWRHGYDVFPDINRTIPFACGATLSYNYIDLQLVNETHHCFSISLWLDNEYLNGEITCDAHLPLKYEIFETDHHFELQWWGGYTRHNKIWKRITDLTTQAHTDTLVANNSAIMMYNPMLEEQTQKESAV